MLIRAQGAMAAAIGLIVLAAWKLRIVWLLSVHPDLPPMSFNTALCLTACGIGLIATTNRTSRWLARSAGTTVVVVAGVTLAQYAFAVDLGIDRLFQRPDLVVWPSHPGRPSSATAVALLMAGLGLLLHDRPLSVLRAVLIGLCGTVVTAIAAVSVFSHVLTLTEGLSWLVGGKTMALHTAVALLLIGVGLAVVAWFVSDYSVPPWWIPLGLGTLGVIATIALWQVTIRGEREHVREEVAQRAYAIRDLMAQRLTAQVQSLVRMASRWENAGAPTEASWRADALLNHAHAGDYQAIAWADAQGLLRWVEPAEGNEGTEGRVLIGEARRRAIFEQARQRREPAITGTLELFAGAQGFLGRGFLVMVPIRIGGGFNGVVVGVFRMENFMSHLLRDDDSDITVELLEGDAIAYEQRTAETPVSRAFMSPSVPVGTGTAWRVRTTAGSALFERERSVLPTAVLAAGFTVSMLLTAVGLLLFSSLRRAASLRVAHQALAEQAHALEGMRDTALAATRAKSAFLATMSHEIRTPMNSLFGVSDLLWDTELSAEQREYVRIFRENGSRLLDLVNDILDLSKVEEGRLELEQGPLDLARIVSETVDLMASSARKKGLTLSSYVDHDIPDVLIGDAARLKQMLVNLAGNAIKFTDTGSVTIAATTDAADAASVVVRCAVTDTGPGIPEAQRQKIFEPFEQADSSITRRHGGTGLGLAICRRLAELMGGGVHVDSQVGEGSTFWFTARLARGAPEDARAKPTDAAAPAGATPPEPAGALAPLPGQPVSSDGPPREPLADTTAEWRAQFTRPEGRPLRILLADDSPDNVLLVRMYVRKYPITIETAENGADAVARFQSGQYDLVFMDGQMPEVDGLTATRRIRAWEAQQGRARTPIVALTAHAMRDEAQRSLDAGCDAHLTKPIRQRVLLSAIARYARGAGATLGRLDAGEDVHVMAELREVVPQFLESRRQDAIKMTRAVDEGQFESIRVAGHNMKGLGGAYGFPRISEIGQALEDAARAGDRAALRAEIDKLSAYLLDVRITYG